MTARYQIFDSAQRGMILLAVPQRDYQRLHVVYE